MSFKDFEHKEQIRMILEVKNKNIRKLEVLCVGLLEKYEAIKMEYLACIHEDLIDELKKLDAEITAARDIIKGLIGW
jgi:hypothetical protein